jgi:phosphatidylserine/phosphatidylglycerophosphate/cardiolipin synthase-like enzyme
VLRRSRKVTLLAGLLIILGCRLAHPGSLHQLRPCLHTSRWHGGEWYSVYFTDPGGPASESLRAGPDQSLAEAIGRARLSVDLAVLRLDLWSVRDALIDAHRGGVSVRLVTDSEYMDEREIQEIIAAGIPVVEDRGPGLMHNKFAVIDRLEVWRGSMNMTVGDAYRNNNNLSACAPGCWPRTTPASSRKCFIDGQFGPDSPPDTPHPDPTIEGTLLENYFHPTTRWSRLVELIRSARRASFHGLFIHLA